MNNRSIKIAVIGIVIFIIAIFAIAFLMQRNIYIRYDSLETTTTTVTHTITNQIVLNAD